MTYQLVNAPETSEVACIKHTNSSNQIRFIPLDPDNTDYQEYLEWVAEGNTPDPAEQAGKGG